MMLRSFRNTHLNGTPEGEAVVREYYRVGPQIVDSINHTENPVALYQNLWERYIEPSCEAIREEKWEKAKGIYIGMVKELCMQFGIGVRPDIRAILKDY